jgi:hypothetical protein
LIVPVSVPPETVQVEDCIIATGPDENEHDVSEPAKPDPVTAICDPGLPDAGFRWRTGGDPTLKRADAVSVDGAAVTITPYTPTVAVFATVNPPRSEPVAEIAHETLPNANRAGGAPGTWLSEHGPASLVLNPTPEIVTTVPWLPELGVSVICAITTKIVGIT